MLKQWVRAMALVCGVTAPVLTALTTLTTLTTAAAAAPQEVERVLRIYDISLLVEPLEDHPGPMLELDRADGLSGQLVFGEDTEDMPSHFDPEELMEIIFDSIEPDSWGHADTRAQVTGATLEVVQTKAVHEKIAALLGALRSELGQQLEVEVQFRKVSGAVAQRLVGLTPGRRGLVDTAKLAELLAKAGVGAGSLAETLAVQLRVGQRSHAAALRERLFVADYDVEVAEKVSSPDPIVRRQRFGAVADLRAFATRDGSKLTLETRLSFAEPGDLKRTVTTTLGTIELPERMLSQCYGTATPALGQTWIGAAGRTDGQAIVFIVTPRERNVATGAGAKSMPKAAGKRITRAYDLGALTYLAPDFPGPSLELKGDGDGVSGGIPSLGSADESAEAFVRLTEDDVVELIQSNLDPDSWEHPRNALQARPGAVMVTHTPAMHGLVRDYLAKLLKSRVAEIRCEAIVVVADDTLQALMHGRTGPAISHAALQPYLASVARVIGYSTFSVQNRQRSSAQSVRCVRVLRDWDTEVAAEAKIGDPIVGVVYEGFVGDLRPTLAGDGRAVALQLRPDVSTLAGPIRTLATAHGDVQLAAIDRRGTPATIVLPLGDWGVQRLGTDAEGREIVLLVSARLVR